MKKNIIILFILFIILILLNILIYKNVYERFEDTPHNLTVYKSPFPKVRIGRNNDGGYLIANVPDITYDLLLSGGIANDSSFEDNFLNIYQDINCYAFDGTVDSSPSNNPKLTFIKKNISPNENEETTNLHNYLNSYKNIFLKMDIEGHEIPWLESVSEEQLNNISQIAMEFHNPYSSREDNVFNKLNKTHYLIHAHANNHGGIKEYNNVMIPEALELTYLNKKYFTDIPTLNDEILPNSLDQPNAQDTSDHILNYPPFVFLNTT